MAMWQIFADNPFGSSSREWKEKRWADKKKNEWPQSLHSWCGRVVEEEERHFTFSLHHRIRAPLCVIVDNKCVYRICNFVAAPPLVVVMWQKVVSHSLSSGREPKEKYTQSVCAFVGVWIVSLVNWIQTLALRVYFCVALSPSIL